jgi:MFS transporter, ACS family, allantoate permease
MDSVQKVATPAESAPQEKRVDPKGADQALEIVGDTLIEIDEATNRRLLRKIDWNVLPWLCTLYFLQYLDKGT